MRPKMIVVGLVALVIVVGIIVSVSARNKKTAEQSPSRQTVADNKETMPKEENAMMDDSHVLGIVIKDSKLMTVWENNVLDTLKHDVVLKNGTVAKVVGEIVTKDGKTINLQTNQELTTDGQLITVDVSKMMLFKEGEMMGKEETSNGNEQAMAKAGSYIAYSADAFAKAEQSGGKTVLFFHAGWCPMCQRDDADIRAHLDKIPADVTILITDYDKETELKQKFGITYQNTYVQVDKNGTAVTKWNNGGQGLDNILANLKSR